MSDVEACSINAQIGKEAFELDFPNGTPVIEYHGEDRANAKYFVSRGGGKRDYITAEEFDAYHTARPLAP
jgi:hypothetical protein